MAANYDIPIDIIPDREFAKAKDLMLYQYAPGTKTLSAQQLDETARSNRAQELLAAQQAKEEARQAEIKNMYNYDALNADTAYKNANLAETVRSNKAAELLSNAKVVSQAQAAATPKMTADQKASGYIQRNMAKFRSPNDMYQQVIANMKAGTVEYSLGATILKQLGTMYKDKITASGDDISNLLK